VCLSKQNNKVLQQFIKYQASFSPQNDTNIYLLDTKGSTRCTSCELLQTMNYFRYDFQTYMNTSAQPASCVTVTVLNFRRCLNFREVP